MPKLLQGRSISDVPSAETSGKSAFYCFAAHSGGDVIVMASHIRAVCVKEAAAFLIGDSAAAESGGAWRTGNGHDTLSEERPKEDVRSLKPLSYLEPDLEILRAIGREGETRRHFGAGKAPKGITRGLLHRYGEQFKAEK